MWNWQSHENRRSTTASAGLMMVLCVLGSSPALGAAEPPGVRGEPLVSDRPAAPKVVTNIWVDTDLRQVIQDISSQTDTVLICDQTVQGTVSMSVKNMPLQDCLERACAVGGYSFLKVKDYYVIGRAEPGSPLFLRMSEPQRVKLSHVLPEQVKLMLHPALSPYVTLDKASDAVMVTAPEPIRQRILNAIGMIDQPSPQVAIEAVVFELTESGSKQLALDWQFNGGHVSMGSASLVNTMTYSAGSDLGTSVNMTLRAIIQSQRGQVLANPRILVMNNAEAEIFAGQEKYFSLLNGQASNPYYTLQSIKAGVTLKVCPYIGANGQITLSLEPEVSDVDQTTDGPTALPVVNRRHAKTVVKIQDGQTVLIGGLLREQNRSTVAKVPLLGDLPLVGAAFRTVDKSKEQQEVVIQITAHIVAAENEHKNAISSRLASRYVTPLDAIAAPLKAREK